MLSEFIRRRLFKGNSDNRLFIEHAVRNEAQLENFEAAIRLLPTSVVDTTISSFGAFLVWSPDKPVPMEGLTFEETPQAEAP